MKQNTKNRPFRVLLVEDNHSDAVLVRHIFEKSEIDADLSIAKTGEQALEMLQKEGEYRTLESPDLVLLDLKLPQISGQDVLKEVKNNPKLKHIPVVVLSGSDAEQDIVKSYNLRADGYAVKPVSLEGCNDTIIIKKLVRDWFLVVPLSEAVAAEV